MYRYLLICIKEIQERNQKLRNWLPPGTGGKEGGKRNWVAEIEVTLL